MLKQNLTLFLQLFKTQLVPHLLQSEPAALVNKEFVFLVDCSNSMHSELAGSPVKSAIRAVTLGVLSLPKKSYFNIILFGSKMNKVFSTCQENNDLNVLKAQDFLKNKQGVNLGSKNLSKVMKFVYTKMTLTRGYTREIYLLTNGNFFKTKKQDFETMNTWARQAVSQARLSVFAINEPRDSLVLLQLARFSRGKLYTISSDERVEPFVISALKQDLRPCIGSIGIEWVGVKNPTLCNDSLQFVNVGQVELVYAFADHIEEDAHVRVKYYDFTTQKLETREFKLFLLDANTALVHSLAAHKQIEKLLVNYSVSASSSSSGSGSKQQQLKQQVQQLSLLYSIPSKFALFTATAIASLEKESKSPASPDSKKVPSSQLSPAVASCYCSLVHEIEKVEQEEEDDEIRRMQEEEEEARSSVCCSLLCDFGSIISTLRKFKDDVYQDITFAEQQSESKPLVSQGTRLLIMDKLLSYQQTDGSWEPLSHVCIILQVERNKLLKGHERQDSEWTTAVCLAVLKSKFLNQRADWELIEVRAMKFLQRRRALNLLDEAKKFIETEIVESVY